MNKLAALLCAVLCLSFLLLVNLQRQTSGGSNRGNLPRLVILYATCSLNKDRLQPYTNSIRFTPNLKAFAKDSVVFQRHESESGFSGAAFANLFTGSYMYRHGIYYHPLFLRNENHTIAEAFRNHHFVTYFWNSHSLASVDYNYGQGIEPKHVSRFSPAVGGLTKKDKKFVGILEELNSHLDHKVFVQADFTMTHAPYSMNSDLESTISFCKNFPEECAGIETSDLQRYFQIYAAGHSRLQTDFDHFVQEMHLDQNEIQKLVEVIRIIYDSSVHLLDVRFGEMLQAIRSYGLLDQSLIVFTSDHGEILYRPDFWAKWTHGNLEPEVIGIPLIVRLPNHQHSGNHFEKVTRSVDVFPTIASLSGITISKSNGILDGTDLSASMLGEKSEPDLVSLSCAGLLHPVRQQNNDPAKMGVQARSGDRIYRLFTQADGSLVMNVLRLSSGNLIPEGYDPNDPTVVKMRALLLKYKNQLVAGYHPSDDRSQWNEIRERLRSLGYLN